VYANYHYIISILWFVFLKGSPSAAVKLLPCDHEVMG
jgi:hypothetical protein